MSAQDNGGPAFPQPLAADPNGGSYTSSLDCNEGGMTLRDYFIAHAPVEPQPWFSPVLPTKEVPLPRFTEMYTDVTDEERGAFNRYDPEYVRVEDVEQERVRNYLFQKEEQRKRDCAYSAMAERERLVQWPAAWADEMLKARAS